MARYLIVRDADNVVVNTTEWDGSSTWSAPTGHTLVADNPVASRGDTWDGSTLSKLDAPVDQVAQDKTNYAAASGTDAKLAFIADKLGLT
jgi:hypothetical protein